VDSARKPAAALANEGAGGAGRVEARATSSSRRPTAERAEAERALVEARRRASLSGTTPGSRSDRYGALAAEVARKPRRLIGRPLRGSIGAAPEAAAPVGDLALGTPCRPPRRAGAAVEALDTVRRRRARSLAGPGHQDGPGRARGAEDPARSAAARSKPPTSRWPGQPPRRTCGAGRELAGWTRPNPSGSSASCAGAATVSPTSRSPARRPRRPTPTRRRIGDRRHAALRSRRGHGRRAAAILAKPERRRRRGVGRGSSPVTDAFRTGGERWRRRRPALDAAASGSSTRASSRSRAPGRQLAQTCSWTAPVSASTVTARSAAARVRGAPIRAVQRRREMVTQLCCGSWCWGPRPGWASSGSTSPWSTSTPTPAGRWRCCLAQAPEEPSFRQVLVTTYEEPADPPAAASIPDTHLIYVLPSARLSLRRKLRRNAGRAPRVRRLLRTSNDARQDGVEASRLRAIETDGLVKRFGETTAVDGIDLAVPAGRCTASARTAPGRRRPSGCWPRCSGPTRLGPGARP